MGGRNGIIDFMRYFSALGIVLFHVKSPYNWVSSTTFLLFVLLLSVHAVPRAPTTEKLRRRLAALLRLWIGWSAVYAALKIGQAVNDGAPVAREFAPWMLMTGPAIHLWFLPFAATITLLGHGIAVAFKALGAGTGPDRRGGAETAALAVLLALLLASMAGAAAIYGHADGAIPVAQWTNAWPAAALGLGVAALRHRVAPPVSAVIACALLFTAGAMLPEGALAGAAAKVAPALLLFALINAVHTPSTALSGQFRSVALNVYLVHPAMIAALLQTGLVTFGSADIFWLTTALSTAAALLILTWQRHRRRTGLRSAT